MVEFLNDQNQPVTIRNKIAPYFQINSEHAEVFYFKLSVKLGKDIQSVTLAQGAVLKISKDIAQFQIVGLKDTLNIRYVDGSSAAYKLELKFQTVQLINRNCNSKNFTINIPNVNDNFYIAASCKDINGSIQASITIPQELSWGASTVFETAGKGERWKLFNFNQLNLSNKSGEIGRITVLKEGVQTPCLVTFLPGSGQGVEEKKIPDPLPRKKIALVRLPIGISQQSIKSDDISASSLGYILEFDGKFFPEKSRWVLSGKYRNVLSVSNDDQTMSFFQVGGGYLLGKEFGSGRTYLAVINFDSFSSQAPKAKVNIVHNQAGINFVMLNYNEKLRQGWTLDIFFSGYLPKADSQIMGLEFQYLFSTQRIGKGIFFNYLSEVFEFKKSTTTDVKSKIQSSQIQTGLVLHF